MHELDMWRVLSKVGAPRRRAEHSSGLRGQHEDAEHGVQREQRREDEVQRSINMKIRYVRCCHAAALLSCSADSLTLSPATCRCTSPKSPLFWSESHEDLFRRFPAHLRLLYPLLLL
jgi:hypothetical protein